MCDWSILGEYLERLINQRPSGRVCCVLAALVEPRHVRIVPRAEPPEWRFVLDGASVE